MGNFNLWQFGIPDTCIGFNIIFMAIPCEHAIAEWLISGPSKQGSLNTFDCEKYYTFCIFEIKLNLKLEKKNRN